MNHAASRPPNPDPCPETSQTPKSHIVMLGFAVFVIVGSFLLRKPVFFRDYAIIWDGATRMVNGQSPFSDFGMPTGPVSLFIPYVFLKAFGTNWLVLQASQLLQSVLVLLASYCLLRQLKEKESVIRVSIGIALVFYLILLSHPWYNITASLLLLISMNLLLALSPLRLFLAGVATGLCLFTKQDFGALSLLFSLVFIAYCALRERHDPQLALRAAGVYLGGVGIVIVAMLCLYDTGYFRYWFNMGQAPHSSRASHILKISFRKLLLAVPAVYVAFRRRDKALLVWGGLFACSIVTEATSGLAFTHNYALFAVPAIVLRLSPRASSRRWLIVLAVYACFSAFKYPYYEFESVVRRSPEHFLFNLHELKDTPNIVDYADCSQVLRNVYGPADVCRLLADIRSALGDRRAAARQGTILNITELTPLAVDLGLQPPLHHPLWYHVGITLFPREQEMILKQIAQSEFDVVLVQGAHEGLLSAFHKAALVALSGNPNYSRLPGEYLTPSNTMDCGERPDCKVIAFVKKAPD